MTKTLVMLIETDVGYFVIIKRDSIIIVLQIAAVINFVI